MNIREYLYRVGSLVKREGNSESWKRLKHEYVFKRDENGDMKLEIYGNCGGERKLIDMGPSSTVSEPCEPQGAYRDSAKMDSNEFMRLAGVQ
jgi:hypothetical protein